jgi:lipopolysaccharide transport system permease protein
MAGGSFAQAESGGRRSDSAHLQGVLVLQALSADVREMVTEQYAFRELLYQMTRRDLLLRYKQTVMGFGWAMFMPVINTILFSVVFMRVAPIDVGVPYPVFAYTGLLAWNFFASSLRFSVASLTANINLVAKVYFPREIFPFSAVIVSAVDFAVGALLLVAMIVYYGVKPTSAILFLPFIVAVQIILTTAVALLLAMANLFYRDVKYLFEVVITVWMFATSVLYPVDRVTGWAGMVLRLNPMTPIVDAYRFVLLRGQLPPMGPILVDAFVSVVLLACIWTLFHRSEFQFAEYI